MKKIAILGSTGSIGTQTLDIVREQGDIHALCLSFLFQSNGTKLCNPSVPLSLQNIVLLLVTKMRTRFSHAPTLSFILSIYLYR